MGPGVDVGRAGQAGVWVSHRKDAGAGHRRGGAPLPHAALRGRPWTRELLVSEPKLLIPSAPLPRRSRFEAAAHIRDVP